MAFVKSKIKGTGFGPRLAKFVDRNIDVKGQEDGTWRKKHRK